MLRMMEEDPEGLTACRGVQADADWCLQYLQDDGIARSFALYYDLFRHFSAQLQTEVGFSLAGLLMTEPEALAAMSSTECLAVAAMLFHPIELEAGRLHEAQRRLTRRGELAAMMPEDDAFVSEDAVRTFLDRKREALEIKVAHDVTKPDEEFRERSVISALEADVVAWRKLPRESRIAFSIFENARMEAARLSCAEGCEKVARDTESAYRALERCPQGRSALLYLTSDLAASKPCAELLAAHPSASFEKYRREIEGYSSASSD
jgi:hypothetical protein